MVVRVDAPAPLQSPYPGDILAPPSALLPKNRQWAVVGVLAANGRLHGLQAATPAQAEDIRLLLPFLEEWTFRPAAQNGIPADVEILLIIT